MHPSSKTLLLCALLSFLAACGSHKPAAPLTDEQLKQQELEKQKQQQESDDRRQQYKQFLAKTQQLQVGETTPDQALALLGNPTTQSADTWIYEVHPSLADPLEHLTLSFRNGKLARVSSSGSAFIQSR